MAGLQPFNLGNTLGTIESIKGARLGNSLRQQKLSQNALAGEVQDTSEIKNYNFYQKLDPKGREQFDHMLRGQNVKKIGGVWNIVTPDGLVPLGSLANEVQANSQLAAGTEGGKVRGREGALTELAPEIRGRAVADAKALKNVDLTMNPQITEATSQAAAGVEIDTAATIAKNTALGKAAAAKANKLFESVDKISTNIQNLGSAMQALKSGAQTGPVAQFLPTIRASTRELMNIQSRLGLDIVGAVTFGALSKGELDLALSTALPVGLDEPELMTWLEEKLESQRKLMDYFSEAGQFLSQPGNTEAMWNELITSGNKADPRSSEQEDPLGLFQ